MNKDNGTAWLDITIGLFVSILYAGGAALISMRGDIGVDFKLAIFVERTLLGAVSVGGTLGLFFGLRTLARMGLRRIGLINRFLWLDVAIALFAAVLWAIGVVLVLDERFDLTNFVGRIGVSAAILGIALGLFYGLRGLARVGLRRIGLIK